jgi:5-methylcytosine-specific restriction endonuclease McrA
VSRGRAHTNDVNRLRADASAQRRPCWLCGQPIDYTLRKPDPNAFTLDHVKPVSTHPHLEHDPTNHAPAHASCNYRRQDKDPKPTLGATSRRW